MSSTDSNINMPKFRCASNCRSVASPCSCGLLQALERALASVRLYYTDACMRSASKCASMVSSAFRSERLSCLTIPPVQVQSTRWHQGQMGLPLREYPICLCFTAVGDHLFDPHLCSHPCGPCPLAACSSSQVAPEPFPLQISVAADPRFYACSMYVSCTCLLQDALHAFTDCRPVYAISLQPAHGSQHCAVIGAVGPLTQHRYAPAGIALPICMMPPSATQSRTMTLCRHGHHTRFPSYS